MKLGVISGGEIGLPEAGKKGAVETDFPLKLQEELRPTNGQLKPHEYFYPI